MTLSDPPSPTPRQSTPSKPRRGHSRTATILATLLLLAAIGSWVFFLRSKPPSKGGPKTNPPATASSTPAVTPSRDPQTSDDLNVAFQAIYAKRTQAIVERRPELVDDIYLPDCACYDLKSIVEEAIRRGEHHAGFQPHVLLVKKLEAAVNTENVVSIRVVTEQGPYTIVDDNGKIIDHDPGWAPQSTSWNLFRNSPGTPWKVGFLLIEGSPDTVIGPDWRKAIN